MITALKAPALVGSFAVGTYFYCHVEAGNALALVCASDLAPSTPLMVVTLPQEFDEDQVGQVWAFDEMQDHVAQPLTLTSIGSDPAKARLNSHVALLDGGRFAVSDAHGCWKQIAGMWVNLNNGVMSANGPTAPWVELGDLELRGDCGAAFAYFRPTMY